MTAVGVVMIVVYAVLVAAPQSARCARAVARGDWPGAAAVAESMRRGVLVNLVLGIVAIVAAIVGR